MVGSVCFRNAVLAPKTLRLRTPLISQFRATKFAALGFRAWGVITMTGAEEWKERRAKVARYRVLEQETTDPLAARLLHDIVSDLEADLKEPQGNGVETNARL